MLNKSKTQMLTSLVKLYQRVVGEFRTQLNDDVPSLSNFSDVAYLPVVTHSTVEEYFKNVHFDKKIDSLDSGFFDGLGHSTPDPRFANFSDISDSFYKSEVRLTEVAPIMKQIVGGMFWILNEQLSKTPYSNEKFSRLYLPDHIRRY